MNSSHSFSQFQVHASNGNYTPAFVAGSSSQHWNGIAQPIYPTEPPSIRRTRKELFVDSDRTASSPTMDSEYNPHSPMPMPNDAVTYHSHPSSLIIGADTAEEPSHIDPMDVWRTYTKRSVDDRQGRAPLTCIWKVGSSEEGLSECGYGATPKLMRRHVQTTHMHIKRYRCDICDQAFSQGALLHSHKASKHAQIRPYKCPFEGCDKAYVDCPTLLRHKKINHNYIPKPITRYR
ncbi:hypothetical protein GYMLUDRAFT_78172 [Collybiopsis luxurians FD-317 M1]|uniref:C2H2-type domain-containing protein n=1 Tax=Collybiopsis luxurians FD-317 M1 TaxID=944289 RepID=A0A0D0BAZ8_9AGAR|nr:hypothetical protein GYMLUDRAFT_78172 [Collybiopsis luxurians FD-317 M1]